MIRTAPPHLVIGAGRKRGTMYGVYVFLEEYVGCRWFTPDVSRIPNLPRLFTGDTDELQVPALEYRSIHFLEAKDPNWAARNRLDAVGSLAVEHGGVAFSPYGGLFWSLIPPDEYFESHPEWFSLVDGERTLKRRYKRTQLCLTNEEMIQQAIDQNADA